MKQEVNDLIQSIPRLPVPATRDTRTNIRTLHQFKDGQRFTLTIADRDVLENFGTPLAFETFGQAIFPGSIVQGGIVTAGLPSQIALPRAPGTIVLTDLTFGSGSPKFSRDIANPVLATIEQARQEMISQDVNVNTPAFINFSLFRFFAAEHACVQLGARAEWLTGDATANLRSAASTTQSNVIASLLQKYYSIQFQAPVAANVFTDEVTLAQASEFMQAGNPPLYVAEVQYGRRIIFIASSQDDATALSVALSASFNSFVSSGNVQVTGEQQRILSQSTITAIITGGPAEPAIKTLAPGQDKVPDLNQLLLDGAKFSLASPGVPIAFQLNYLRDNAVALVSFATGAFTESTLVPDPFRINEIDLRFLVDDDDKDRECTAVVDLIGPDGNVVSHGVFGNGQVWKDHDVIPPLSQAPFRFVLTPQVLATDLNSMRIRVAEVGCDTGWHTRYDLTAIRDDGAVLPVGHSPKPRHELGEGEPTSFEDPFSA